MENEGKINQNSIIFDNKALRCGEGGDDCSEENSAPKPHTFRGNKEHFSRDARISSRKALGRDDAYSPRQRELIKKETVKLRRRNSREIRYRAMHDLEY